MQVAPLDLAADLAVQVAQGGDGVVIEVAAVDERPHHLHQFRFPVAGEGARLDPGVALPFAALGDEVVFQRIEAGDERTAVAVRPQPHVDAEHEAVSGQLGERGDQLAAETREILVIADDLRSARVAFLGIDEDEIQVGGNIEFRAAGLAHADHVQLLLAPARGADRPPVAGGEPLVQRGQRVAHGDFGQRGGGREHFLERREAGEVARDQAQHYPRAQHAQRALQSVLVRAGAGRQRGAHFIRSERTLDRGIQLPVGRGFDEPARVVAQSRGARQQVRCGAVGGRQRSGVMRFHGQLQVKYVTP